MKREGIGFLCFFLTMAMVALMTEARADMGAVSASDIKVSEEAQKAIIIHNLEEEILILGTDLKAERGTSILRFIPFPAEPAVTLAPGDPFGAALKLIKRHDLKFLYKTKGAGTEKSPVEIRFSQRLGAHDQTIIKVNNAAHFRDCVNDFFSKKGVPQRKEYPGVEEVVDDYVKRGIAYFVFDFVDVTEATHFIEPMAYRFATKALYYPLKTSNTFGGIGSIDLILISPRTLCDPVYDLAYYVKQKEALTLNPCLGLPNVKASTSAKLEKDDLKDIYPVPDAFFGDKNIYLQFVRTIGEYRFNRDVLVETEKGADRAVSEPGEDDRFGIRSRILN